MDGRRDGLRACAFRPGRGRTAPHGANSDRETFSLGGVAYHTRALVAAGLLRAAGTTPRRGRSNTITSSPTWVGRRSPSPAGLSSRDTAQDRVYIARRTGGNRCDEPELDERSSRTARGEIEPACRSDESQSE